MAATPSVSNCSTRYICWPLTRGAKAIASPPMRNAEALPTDMRPGWPPASRSQTCSGAKSIPRSTCSRCSASTSAASRAIRPAAADATCSASRLPGRISMSAVPASMKASAVLITIGDKFGSRWIKRGRCSHQPIRTVPPSSTSKPPMMAAGLMYKLAPAIGNPEEGLGAVHGGSRGACTGVARSCTKASPQGVANGPGSSFYAYEKTVFVSMPCGLRRLEKARAGQAPRRLRA